MKKLLWMTISLISGILLVSLFVAMAAPSAFAAPPLQTGGADPEPAVNTPLVGTGVTPEAVLATLEPAWNSSSTDFTNQLAWGDYDQDGDLDLLTGNSGDNRLYQNDGNPTNPTLTEIDTLVCQNTASDTTQSIEWGDYDQDGDLDIVIGNSNNRNCVLQNNGGTFDLAWLADVILDTRSVSFAGWEFNNEFNMYLAVGNGSEPTNIYRFEGGTFDLWWTETTVFATNVVAWGDYDNDGDPDLVLGNFGQPNRLYRNDLTTLTFVGNLPGTLNTRDLAWGDMNGDGYLDLAQGNGQSLGNSDTARVYCNSGSPGFTFSECWEAAESVSTFSVAWGDYEGDGDLDLALSSEEDGVTRIYENDGTTLGTDPVWDADDDTANSRSVAWADWNGDGDLEFTVGYFGGATQIYENMAGVFQSTSYGSSAYDARSVAWGDFDSDGDFDLAVGNSSSAPSLVYENIDGVLSLAFTAPFAENTRNVAWGDYDGDGDLDLALGNGATGTGQANRLYENVNGNLVNSPDFFDSSPSNTYAVAWGDFDGDGDLDLATGNYEAFQPVLIHRNDGGVFTTTLSVGGTASDLTLSLAAGDFDQDYDLDLVLGNDNGPERVLINDGSGNFTIQTLPEPTGACFISPGSDTWSVAWADYDGDGDLDIAAGHAGFTGCIQVIESAFVAGAWTFNTVYQSTDTSLDVRSVVWGDWDGDGDLDLAAGISGSFGRRNRIYRNDNGVFTLAWTAPTAEADTTRGLAWGDADGDGDLDLATANALTPTNPGRLYYNNWKHGWDTSDLPNDAIRAELLRPDGMGDAYFYSSAQIQGQSILYVPFYLSDDEGDRAYKLEFQVSWDGGGSWEPACEVGEDCTAPSGVWTNTPTQPNGEKTLYTFAWNALYHLLAHQELTLDYDNNAFVASDQSEEEMDVAFRVVPYSNPYHGGLIQRPEFGSSSTLSRVDMRPEWAAAKFNVPEHGIPGQFMEYTVLITQTDHGMPPAYLIDEVPDFMELVGFPSSSDGFITTTQGVITWTNFLWFGELFPWGQRVQTTDAVDYPQTMTFSYNTFITRPLTNGLVITNTALIFDGLHEPFPITNTFTISSSPILTESWKLVNDQPENFAVPGETMTYTIVLTNTGTENAYVVTMTDVIPAEVEWGGNLSASSGSASFADGTVTWLGDVRVFEPVFITFTVNVDDPQVGTYFTNTFEIRDSSIITPFVSTPVTTTVLAPNFLPSYKTATTNTVELGDVLTYTIVLENIGLTDAYSVTLTDPMPGASAYISDSFQASSGAGGYNPETGAIEWSSPLIETDETVVLSFAVVVDLPDLPTSPILTNTATLEDPVSGVYTLVHTATVNLPDFDASYKTGSAEEVALGDVLTYTIWLENQGGRSPITTLTDTIPVGSAYISGTFSATAGVGGYFTETEGIAWSGDVAGGEVITLTFAITVGAPITIPYDVITNTAFLVDAVGVEYVLVDTAQILPPDLSSSSKTGTPNLIELGDLLTYTITINNTGANALGITMTDPITVGLEYAEGSFTSTVGTGGFNPLTGAINWTGDLGTGETAQVQFTVLAECPLTGTMFTNHAWIVDPLGVETPVSTETTVFMPDLSSSSISADLTAARPGALLTYQITVRNTGGNAPFASFATLPLVGQTYVDSSATLGEVMYDSVNKVVNWTGNLPTGAEAVVTLEVLVGNTTAGVSLSVLLNTGCATTPLDIFVPSGAIYLPIVRRQ